METCGGAHFLARARRDQGHDARLIAAKFVRPYRKSNKNDYRDAEAIAEAVSRKNMRFVPIKTDEQLDLHGVHRVRARLVRNRTIVINQIRGFLLERGICFKRHHQAPQRDARGESSWRPRVETPTRGRIHLRRL
jgi:transposase